MLIVDLAHQCDDPLFQQPVASQADLKRQIERLGNATCPFLQLIIRPLDQVDQSRVVAKIHWHQLRKAIQTEPFVYRAAPATCQEIRQKERARLLDHQRLERRATIHFIAMRSRDARNIVAGKHLVELATRATVTIDHHDSLERCDKFAQTVLDIRRNPFGMEVIAGRDAKELDIPSIMLDNIKYLARKRAAEHTGNFL